ncbi:MAG: diguanylate cyclase, partial [Methyloprofundus sp.]|nr:diguanylate cyclase [Methyloprofundus sp.]
ELENVIERAVILSPEPSLQIAALHNPKLVNTAEDQPLLSLADMEKAHIIKVLESVQWQISGENGSAAILEMHPNTLRSRMNKLGIRRAVTAL